MNSGASARGADTVDRRLEKYARFQKLDVYLGGGLGGVILFGDLAKDAFTLAPDWLRALFITSALLTGACIGFAYSGFQWAETDLQRKLDDTKSVNKSSKIDEVSNHVWPQRAYRLQRLAPILIAMTAGVLIIAAWWPVVACD
ncbi:MAG TPA: hypothetical protein VHU90_09515 [Galbitalea sp.]|jgi:hypothetical protein|nr:hypothetical protein [Galbitalea sp.]